MLGSDKQFHIESYAKSLRVPDGSRAIFDANIKYEAMKKLSIEMDDLVKEVAKEQKPSLQSQDGLLVQPSRDAIWSLNVP